MAEATPDTIQTDKAPQRPPVSDTGAIDGNAVPSPENAPRKRGRPKGTPKTGGRKPGTKNWTSAEIRNDLLGRSEAIETLSDMCAGRQLLISGPTGKEHWRRPTMPERIKAVELVLNKCVPSLQATELSGPDGEKLIPEAVYEPRHVARAILATLGAAAPDHKISVEEPDTHVAKFHDPDLGRKILPDNPDSETGFSSGPNPLSAGGGSSGPPPAASDTEPIGSNGHFIERREVRASGEERWSVIDPRGQLLRVCNGREEAEQAARQHIETGKIDTSRTKIQ